MNLHRISAFGLFFAVAWLLVSCGPSEAAEARIRVNVGRNRVLGDHGDSGERGDRGDRGLGRGHQVAHDGRRHSRSQVLWPPLSFLRLFSGRRQVLVYDRRYLKWLDRPRYSLRLSRSSNRHYSSYIYVSPRLYDYDELYRNAPVYLEEPASDSDPEATVASAGAETAPAPDATVVERRPRKEPGVVTLVGEVRRQEDGKLTLVVQVDTEEKIYLLADAGPLESVLGPDGDIEGEFFIIGKLDPEDETRMVRMDGAGVIVRAT